MSNAKRWDISLHWRDGSITRLTGYGATGIVAATDAMNKAGFGNGALPALDYWAASPDERTATP